MIKVFEYEFVNKKGFSNVNDCANTKTKEKEDVHYFALSSEQTRQTNKTKIQVQQRRSSTPNLKQTYESTAACSI